MLKLILLETPGVIETEEFRQRNTDWKTLIAKAKENGIRTKTLPVTMGDDIAGIRLLCSKYECIPQECLVLAADSKLLSMAEQIGMPCVAYGEAMPAFRTRYQITTAAGAELYYLQQIHQRLIGEPVTIAKTERLIIREMTVADAEALWEIQNRQEVRRYTENLSEDRQNELEKHKAYVTHVYPLYGYGLWGVYRKEDEKLIGRCGLQDYEHDGTWEIEIGYLLDPPEWGKGYATEAVWAVLEYAFECMDMQSAVALIEPENERSVRLAKRVGMQFQAYDVRDGKTVARYLIQNRKKMDI